MKLKRLLSVIGLGLFAAVSAGAGVALSSKPKAEPVKATGEDKMISVVIDLADAVGYPDFHKPEVHYYDSSYSTIDAYADLHQLTGTYYTANLPYDSSTQNIDCIQFLFKQYEEDKWSNSIALNSSPSTVYHYSFQNTWTGNNWDVVKDSTWWGVPRVRGDGGFTDTNFIADVDSRIYKASNLNLTAGITYQIFYGKWNFGAFRQSSIDAYLADCSLNSFEVSESGTYDIYARNDYSDGGIFEIYKHESESSYVYIVNESTDCYIYTFGAGGQERFGAFPGTQISDLISAGEAEDIGNSELSFQNLTTSILKVNVEVGYPVADHLILAYKNELGYVGNQTADMLLVAGSAYWFSNDADYHNDDAGITLDSLCNLRTALYSADGESVCNMVKADAEALVNEYNSLTAVQRETYFDCSELETLKRDGSAGHEFVNCKLIMQEVAKIAEIDLVGSPRTIVSENGVVSINSTTLIAVISVIALVSVSSIVVLVVIKKRKHN